jgi:hypothetical protein
MLAGGKGSWSFDAGHTWIDCPAIGSSLALIARSRALFFSERGGNPFCGLRKRCDIDSALEISIKAKRLERT